MEAREGLLSLILSLSPSPHSLSPRSPPLRFSHLGPHLRGSVCASPTRPALSFPPSSQARHSDPKAPERGGSRPRGA